MLLKGVAGGCDEKRVESSSRELVSRATVVVRSKRDEARKAVTLRRPCSMYDLVPRSNLEHKISRAFADTACVTYQVSSSLLSSLPSLLRATVYLLHRTTRN
jgi:hypothetical protein